MQTTMWIVLLMAAIAIVNAGLMAWLWRFPMRPDPSGRNPNGISTAPLRKTKKKTSRRRIVAAVAAEAGVSVG